MEKVPQHIAIIMDGNGRWAKKRGMPRNVGHSQGSKTVRKICEEAWKFGVKYLTVYAFSTENWNRSTDEVNFLMDLFYTELTKNMKHALEKNIRCRVIGSRDRLPEKLAALCDELEEKTAENTGGTVAFAVNYGGQQEIVDAVNMAISAAKPVTLETFETYLDTGDLLPIDLIEIDVQQAFDYLGQITGEAYPEELITALFTKFCLGK